jgi:hypothetical protein
MASRSQEEVGIRIRRPNKKLLRARLNSQLGSQFHGTIAANGAGNVPKTNGITGVCVWLIELRGNAECPGRIFSRSVNHGGQK